MGAEAIERCAGLPRFVPPEAWYPQWLTPESVAEKEGWRLLPDGNAIELSEPTAVDPQLPYGRDVGGMFWLRRRTLLGSYRRFSAWRRSNARSPTAARTRSIGSSACM